MWLNILSAIIGGGVGWVIPGLDKIVYIYILHPEAQISQYIQDKIQKKQFRSAFETLNIRVKEFDKLTTRSALFQIVWVVLAIFTLTSVSGFFGKFLVMSLGLRMLVEAWREYLKDRQKLKRCLFWQIKREVSDEELKWYLYGLTGVFMGLVWWWI